MIREVDRLSGLVEHVMELAALPPPQFAPLNIHRLITDVLLLTREAPAATGITVRCQFDPSLPPVCGDERQLKQVLLNLIANACEAMGSRGTLTLTTRIETDFHIVRARHLNSQFIRVEIADDGPASRPRCCRTSSTPSSPPRPGVRALASPSATASSPSTEAPCARRRAQSAAR